MAEEGIVMQDGQPIMGAGAGNKTKLVPVGVNYVAIAASSVASALGANGANSTGAVGDYLAGLLIIPATVSAGAVTVKDGGGSAITVFAGGNLSDLKSFYLPIGARSTSGAWALTTSAGVSVLAVGAFT